MNAEPEEFIPSHEAPADPAALADSIRDLPRYVADTLHPITMDDVNMDVKIGDEVISGSPDDFEFQQANKPGFVRAHKKGALIGTITAAAVVAAAATVGYKKRHK